MRLITAFVLGYTASAASIGTEGTFFMSPPSSISHGTYCAVDFGTGQISLMALKTGDRESLPVGAMEKPKDHKAKSGKPTISLVALIKEEPKAGDSPDKRLADWIIASFKDIEPTPTEGNIRHIFGGGTASVRQLFQQDPSAIHDFIDNVNTHLAASHMKLHFSVISQDMEGACEALSASELVKRELNGAVAHRSIGTVGFGSGSIQVSMFHEHTDRKGDKSYAFEFGRDNAGTLSEKQKQEIQGATFINDDSTPGMMVLAGASVFVLNYTDAGAANVGKLLERDALIDILKVAHSNLSEDKKGTSNTWDGDSKNKDEDAGARALRKKKETEITSLLSLLVTQFPENTQFFVKRIFDCENSTAIKTGWVTGHYIQMRTNYIRQHQAEFIVTEVARTAKWYEKKMYIGIGSGAVGALAMLLIVAVVKCFSSDSEVFEDDDVVSDGQDDSSDNASKKGKAGKGSPKKDAKKQPVVEMNDAAVEEQV